MNDQTKQLLELPGITIVCRGLRETDGVLYDDRAVVVYVEEKKPLQQLTVSEVIPTTVDGIKTDVRQSGVIHAQAYTDKYRPAPGGVSIGHHAITAGTLGVTLFDNETEELVILSNNHVLANSNDGQIGDAIIQPGSADGGTVANDHFANLLRFTPIVFEDISLPPLPPDCQFANVFIAVGNTVARALNSSLRVHAVPQAEETINYYDAAVASPLSMSEVYQQILDIGMITGTQTALLGQPVRKTGRTTEHTTDIVQGINASVRVSYGAGKTALFEDQLVAGPMSQGGDSGSLVVDGESTSAVGLLFAGSDSTTIFSPIARVLEELNLHF